MSGARSQTTEDQGRILPEQDRSCFVCLAHASRLLIMQPSGCGVKSVVSMEKTGNRRGSAGFVIFVNFIDTCPDLRHLPGQKMLTRKEADFCVSLPSRISPARTFFARETGLNVTTFPEKQVPGNRGGCPFDRGNGPGAPSEGPHSAQLGGSSG